MYIKLQEMFLNNRHYDRIGYLPDNKFFLELIRTMPTQIKHIPELIIKDMDKEFYEQEFIIETANY